MNSSYLSVPLTWEGMESLIEVAQKESATLDYKSSLYDLSAEEQKDEFAKDISSFANNNGGVLILGIKDLNNSASALMPVQFSDRFESRCQQVIGSHVSPRIPLKFLRINDGTDSNSGILLIEIPKSSDAPHGAFKDGRIRYAMRNGMDTRYLSEVEVADMYKRRFLSMELQETELQKLQFKANLNLDPSQGWLILALVPRNQGAIPLNTASLEKFKTKYENKFLASPIPLFQTGRVKVGFGKFVIESYSPSSPTTDFGINLFQGGAGLMYVGVRPGEVSSNLGVHKVFPEKLFAYFGTPMMEILVLHALEAGASGEFGLQVDFQTIGAEHFGLSNSNPITREERLVGELVLKTQPGTISFEGSELGQSFKVRMQVCRALLSSFLNNFGLTDFPYISEDGSLVPSAIDSTYAARILEWEALKFSSEIEGN